MLAKFQSSYSNFTKSGCAHGAPSIDLRALFSQTAPKAVSVCRPRKVERARGTLVQICKKPHAYGEF